MSGGIVLELFGGPGGLAEGARMAGIRNQVGVELDRWACATRAAAGHKTIRADVTSLATEPLSGRVRAVCGSPPCLVFSMAGKRAGVAVTDVLDALIRDLFEGGKTRAAHRREMARLLTKAWWPDPKWTREKRSAAIWKAVRSASLVAEPARFIAACDPEWVALEQVPAVLPLWEVYADELRKAGYSAWCGKLNAADYGVAQTRIRAILIASRVRQVGRPMPTHSDPRKGPQLFTDPWVSMAAALGWGMTERPYFTLATAGGNRGGADEQVGGSGARRALYAERDAGDWVVNPNASGQMRGYVRSAERPSPGLTGQVQHWSLHRSRGAGLDRRDHPAGEPAPTITGAGGKPGANLTWVHGRPATTVQCDERVFPPHAGSRGEHQSADAVRITAEEAAALQSFPPGYPFQGSKTAIFGQIGNAVPPLLAAHVLSVATGLPLPSEIAGAA